MISRYPTYCILVWLNCLIITSCAHGGKPGSTSITDDSLYALTNITNSQFQIDSNTFKKLVPIDSIQKIQFIHPDIVLENPDVSIVGQAYINKYMPGLFISKQNKIGDLQPVVVSLAGDDYHALILILLNKDNKPVNHILLSGGIEGGPDKEIGDSLIFIHQRESIIHDDEVLTYILKVCVFEKENNKPPVIDSISFTQKILPSGKINIIKRDSSRYSRNFDWASNPKYWW